ncbi:hypothetical protein P4C99_19390 [Pontiellaceae bacterium B1224]|nr:hypothetical protein [Pontiellaceae bacterium B1224]
MLNKIILTFLLMAAVSQAAVKELIPNLTSDNLDVQTQARLDLLAACSEASSPDATEADRKAICLEMCEILAGNYDVVEVIQPVLNNLERIGGEESVPTLGILLDHSDEHIRDDARRALAVNPSQEATQVLGKQLKMRKARSAKETAGLIMALGERQIPGASNLIVGYVNSKDPEIFLAAVKALGYLNEDVGVKALATQRGKESGFRKMQIDAALLSTKRKIVFENLNADSEMPEVQAAALMGLILSGETGLAADAMASGNPVQQLAVIEATLQSEDASLCKAVANQIGNLPAYLQVQALGALEFSGNGGYAVAIEPLLKSDDTLVQDSASRALARIGTAASVVPLLANGRPDALRALGVLNADGVDAALEKLAATGDSRVVAINALAARGRTDLIPAFFKYAAVNDEAVAKASVKAIGSLGTVPDLEPLVVLMIDQESSRQSRDILNAIVEIMRRSSNQAEAVKILVGNMEGASPRSQANILQALVQTGSDEALIPLAAACKSPDETLQKSAVKLLGSWKNDNAIPTMVELASDTSMSTANHVNLMRGVSRLLAGQRRLNRAQAEMALEACRRPEERQLIQDLMDRKRR